MDRRSQHMLDSVREPLALGMSLTPRTGFAPFKEGRASLCSPLALSTWLSHCYKEGGVAAGVALQDLMKVEDMPVGVVSEVGAWPPLGLCFNCFLFSEGGLSS